MIDQNVGEVADKLGFGAADMEAACAAAAVYRVGDAVEVFGLDTVNGRELNGKTGTIIRDSEGSDAVQVRVDLDGPFEHTKYRTATLKACNLKKISQAGLGDSGNDPLRGLRDKRNQQQNDTDGARFTRTDLHVDPTPGEEQASDALFAPGDVVEISNLTSEAGQQINGFKAVVVKCIMADGRAEVRFETGTKKLKFENLEKLDLNGGDRYMVEVFGLQSEAGKAMNGQRGVATAVDKEKGRIEVKLTKDKKVSLKPENLLLVNVKK